jgi:hypothetical protein
VKALAGRINLSEGQLYSSAITLAVAVLLMTGLGNMHGVVSTSLSQAPLALPPAPSLPDVAVPRRSPTPAPNPAPTVPPPMMLPAPAPAFAPTSLPPLSDTSFGPGPTPTASPTPSTTPCAAKPADDQVRAGLETANDVAGGGLPVDQILAILTAVDGCTGPSPSASPSPVPSLSVPSKP